MVAVNRLWFNLNLEFVSLFLILIIHLLRLYFLCLSLIVLSFLISNLISRCLSLLSFWFSTRGFIYALLLFFDFITCDYFIILLAIGLSLLSFDDVVISFNVRKLGVVIPKAFQFSSWFILSFSYWYLYVFLL